MSQTPLLNRIRTGDLGGSLRPPGWMNPDDRKLWRKHLDQMLQQQLRNSSLPAFNIDRVAHYYFVEDPREYWDLAELTGLHAPYPACWMEYVFPGKIHSEIGDQDNTEFGRVDTGWLIFQVPKSDLTADDFPETGTHALILERFELYEKLGYVTGPDGTWGLAVDGAGKIINRPYFQTWAERERLPELAFLQTGLHIPLLACSSAAVAGLRQPARSLWDPGAGKTHTKKQP